MRLPVGYPNRAVQEAGEISGLEPRRERSELEIKIWESLACGWQLKPEEWIKSPRKSGEQEIRKVRVGVGERQAQEEGD